MRKTRWIELSLMALVFGSGPALAQFAAPGGAAGAAAAPAAAPANGAGAAAGAAAAPGFFMKCCAVLAECKKKLCATPAGQLLNSMTLPLSTLTGGVFPSCCPMPFDPLAQGVEGAAGQAKKDEMEAKARRAAVRYLGTLDCRYYPEAEAALIAALRTDRVECVRLEAAIAFANGCCCTRKVLEALEICVSGSEKDGNPAERSERVRDIAFIALNRCLACYHEPPVEVEPEKKKIEEIPRETPKGDVLPKPQTTKVDRELLERARKTAADYQAKREGTIAGATPLHQGQRTLFNIFRYSADGPAAAPVPQAIQQPVMQPVSRPVQPPMAAPAPTLAPAPRVLPQARLMPAPTTPPTAAKPPEQEPQVSAVENTQAATPATPVLHQDPPPETLNPAAQTIDLKPTLPAADPKPAPQTIDLKPTLPTADPKPAPQTIDLKPVAPVASTPAPQTIDLKPVAPVASTPAPQTITMSSESGESVNNLIDAALTGTTPKERHQAIHSLAGFDWKKSPQIVAGLVKAARLDSDRAVRVSAIRHITALKMDLPYVIEHLKYMQKDQDDWVRQEATLAMEKLQASQ